MDCTCAERIKNALPNQAVEMPCPYCFANGKRFEDWKRELQAAVQEHRSLALEELAKLDRDLL